ncbi:MAG: YegP family protein [Chromatocurvus sp.]
MTATNGQVIGKSQMYTGITGMEKGIKSVTKNAPAAETRDLTDAKEGK